MVENSLQGWIGTAGYVSAKSIELDKVDADELLAAALTEGVGASGAIAKHVTGVGMELCKDRHAIVPTLEGAMC